MMLARASGRIARRRDKDQDRQPDLFTAPPRLAHRVPLAPQAADVHETSTADVQELSTRLDQLTGVVARLEEELASGTCRPSARLGDELQIRFEDNGLSRRFRLVEVEAVGSPGDQGPHRLLHQAFIGRQVGHREVLGIAGVDRTAMLTAIYRELAGTSIRMSSSAPEGLETPAG